MIFVGHTRVRMECLPANIEIYLVSFFWCLGSSFGNEVPPGNLLGPGSNVSTNCSCDLKEVVGRLPYILKSMSQDMIESATHRSKGDRGEEGHQGPEGPRGPMGIKGQKGDAGEPGVPGLPGASHISVRSGPFGSSYLPDSLKGDKGDPGTTGLSGKRGVKGERGDAVGFVVHNGQFTVVKGKKGDRGRRGRQGPPGERGKLGPRGEPGTPGLSFQGKKGSKGEPAEMPDLELLRGPPGPRGPPGTCRSSKKGKFENKLSNEITEYLEACQQGEPGPPGPPGSPATSESLLIVPGAVMVESLVELFDGKMSKMNIPVGSIVFVYDSGQLLLRDSKEWKEILTNSFREIAQNDSGNDSSDERASSEN